MSKSQESLKYRYEDWVKAFAYALATPALHPLFKDLPLVMGTAGEMEANNEMKWIYKISYNDNRGSTEA